MASNSAMSKADRSKGKTSVTTRHFWTKAEEDVLLRLLENMVTNEGWKSDGTFQGGYMLRLEKEMNAKLLGCGLTKMNIKSKMTVWKKTHFALRGMLGSSGAAGFRMDPELNMILEDRPDAWNEYTRANPNEVKLVRNKEHPYHVRWEYIFGTDNAGGEAHVDYGDARDENLNVKGKNIDGNVNYDNTTPSNYDGTNTEFDDEVNSFKGSSKGVDVGKTASSKKRKSIVDDPAKIGAMIGEWMELAKSQFGVVSYKMMGNGAEEVDQPHLLSQKRASIYNAVAEVCNLEVEDIIKVSRHLSHNEADQDIFWGMPQTIGSS